jgi:hypothetical protein
MDLKRNRVIRNGLYSFVKGQGAVVGSCECGNEPLHSIKGMDRLAEQQLATQGGLCFMELLAFVYTGKGQL